MGPRLLTVLLGAVAIVSVITIRNAFRPTAKHAAAVIDSYAEASGGSALDSGKNIDGAASGDEPSVTELLQMRPLLPAGATPPAAGQEWDWFVDADVTYAPHAGRRHPSFPHGSPMPRATPVLPQVFTSAQRRVVDVVRYAWRSYKAHAWGHDELLPGRKSFRDWGRGDVGHVRDPPSLAVTMIESLDTLYLCGLKAEFDEAVRFIDRNVTFDLDVSVNLFETSIRVLGGLLSAYELSAEPVLLDRAHDLGRRLLNAFDAQPACPPCRSVVPMASVNLKTGVASHPAELGDAAWLSEVASIQLEFRKLAFHTGLAAFDYYPQRVMHALLPHLDSRDGALFPLQIERVTVKPIDASGITLGARGDSFVEYLAKQAALDDWRDGPASDAALYARAWVDTVEGVADLLTVRANATHSFVVRSVYDSFRRVFKRDYRMDHLTCFLPGALRVGAPSAARVFGGRKVGAERTVRELQVRQLELARTIERTCVGMYHTSPVGLAPEIFQFRKDTLDAAADPGAKGYHLRPETLEALFYATRLDPSAQRRVTAREEAARIVDSIEAQCRVAGGYAGVSDTTRAGSGSLEVMETFFVAETLKYAFLALQPQMFAKPVGEGAGNEDVARVPLVTEDTSLVLPLRDWVFNTEAHPLRKLRAPMRYEPPPKPGGKGTSDRRDPNGNSGIADDNNPGDVALEILANELRDHERRAADERKRRGGGGGDTAAVRAPEGDAARRLREDTDNQPPLAQQTGRDTGESEQEARDAADKRAGELAVALEDEAYARAHGEDPRALAAERENVQRAMEEARRAASNRGEGRS